MMAEEGRREVNQNSIVLAHLTRIGPLTPKEAMDKYGIMRLGARIYDLKQDGHNIIRGWEEAPNRYGEPTRYARYFYRGRGADGLGKEVQDSGDTSSV